MQMLFITITFLMRCIHHVKMDCPSSSTAKGLPNTAIFIFNATLPINQFLIDGTEFHTQVLKMNSKELQEFRSDSITYLNDVFGINPIDHSRDAYIQVYESNPLIKMRCIYMTGEDNIPSQGLSVRDGGVIATVVNPKGLTLGGNFQGVHAMFGTTFSVGHWVIERRDGSGKRLEPRIWKNRHIAPGVIATADRGSRSSHGIMEVVSEEWGIGESMHIAKYLIDQKGQATAHLRNVITF